MKADARNQRQAQTPSETADSEQNDAKGRPTKRPTGRKVQELTALKENRATQGRVGGKKKLGSLPSYQGAKEKPNTWQFTLLPRSKGKAEQKPKKPRTKSEEKRRGLPDRESDGRPSTGKSI